MAIGIGRSGKMGDSKKGPKPQSVNAVLKKLARSGGKLSTRIIPAEMANEVPVALIEGDREVLILLGQLLIAQADAPGDSVHIAPKSAGKRLFGRSSTIGLYIHRRGT
jgi:hypothetical protein